MKYKDKVVWITGASSGIGEALAYAFHNKGAKLILSARGIEKLEKVKQNCENGHEVYLLPLDLEVLDTLGAHAQTAWDVNGGIDLLIHSGGISQRAFAVKTDLIVDHKIMNVNYFGAVTLTKAILPKLLEQKSGHLVVISSLTGKFGTPLRSAYAASKHALHGFFDSLRAEIHEDNVQVCIVCPGFVKTNISLNAEAGDGKIHGQMDAAQEAGISPAKCARKILKAIRKNKEEVIIGGKESMGVYIKRFFPKLFSKLIRRVAVK